MAAERMDIMHHTWRPNLAELPARPGVYLFRNARGAVLYVGKAVNLRRRVASYFHRRRRRSPRLRCMVGRARAVTWHETGSELEALLLESRLIKQESPPFNRLSVAYVALPFVRFTVGEPFPRLVLTRELVYDGSQYLGPFPSVDSAAVVLAALQRLFPLRTCEAEVRPGVSPVPCEAYHLRTCAAPCAGSHAVPAYQRHVRALVALLARGRAGILQRLREERQRAADGMFFERAGHLHTLLNALDAATIGRPLTLLPVALRNFVVIFARAERHAYEVYGIRHGLFVGRLVGAGKPRDWEAVEAFLTRCYGQADGAPQAGEAAVDELRIVAGWLQRTRARARWIRLDARMNLTAACEAVMGALP
jgi:excinuclease UvrABC nuclease subunit